MTHLRTALVLSLAIVGPFCKRDRDPAPAAAPDSGPVASAIPGDAAAPRAAVRLPSAAPKWMNLAPAGFLSDPPKGAFEIHGLGDAILVVGRDGAASVYKAGDDKPSAKVPPKDTCFSAPNLAGALVVCYGMGKLNAWDTHTLEKRWSIAEALGNIYAIAGNADTVFAAVNHDKHGNELLSIEARTGRVRWRRPCTLDTKVFPAGARFVVSDDKHVELDSAETGEKTWSKDLPVASFATRVGYADAERIISADYETTSVLATADGSVIGAIHAKGGRLERGLRDGTSFFALGNPLTSHLKLLAFDVTRAEQAWEQLYEHGGMGAVTLSATKESPKKPAANYGSGLALDDDVVLVNGGDGVLRAHERSDGTLRWSWPLFGGASVALLRSPHLAVYAFGADGQIVVMKPGAAAQPEHATFEGKLAVDGKPAAKARLWIGDTSVETDEAGAFKAEVDAVGNVRLAMRSDTNEGGKSCLTSVEKIVTLAGKKTYPLTLAATKTCLGPSRH